MLGPPFRDDQPGKAAPFTPQYSLGALFVVTAVVASACSLVVWLGVVGALLSLWLVAGLTLVVGILRRNDALVLASLIGGSLVGVVTLWAFVDLSDREGQLPDNAHINLKRIGIAMHAYHQDYGCFPPATLVDAQGRPLHSWRVLLLPYLDWGAEYELYELTEPWDGPNNSRLASSRILPHVYSWPGRRDTRHTGFVVVVGEQTAFPPNGNATRLEDILDGAQETILVVACADSGIHWTEPRDLQFDQMSFSVDGSSREPHIGGSESEGALCLLADGRVVLLPSGMSPEVLRSLLTATGGEEVNVHRLFKR